MTRTNAIVIIALIAAGAASVYIYGNVGTIGNVDNVTNTIDLPPNCNSCTKRHNSYARASKLVGKSAPDSSALRTR